VSARLFGNAWRQLRGFSGLGGDATYLWPRWIVLRGVGLVYILVFAGIIAESRALIGPHGISPIASFFGGIQKAYPDSIKPFILAPSLFWFNSGEGMITLLEWMGLAAAVALVLNFWPRMALFGCWLIFLSFISAWGTFSPAQLDDLMLETALLCIPFAPAGFRPGLGARSPPRPITVFMMRWLLFRIMLESGLVKIIAGDPHWRNFTALDIMYETAPFPTILGYLDHHLGHAYHLFEYALTFAAELVSPLVAVFGGRRGRWFAFVTWVLFQVGIQLTANFGWLNTASIAVGILLLDDQMLASLCRRVCGKRLPRLNAAFCRFETGRAHATAEPRQAGLGYRRFCKWGLRAALSLQFYLTLVYFLTFVRIARGLPPDDIPAVMSAPRNLFWNFHSANEYNLYARFDPVRHGVEFAGSNDGGRTWRPYEYRYISQRVDRICPFIAPWFPRFEASLQDTERSEGKSRLFRAVAAQLLAGNPEAIGLFPSDPFPDRPPTAMRTRYYTLSFTPLDVWRKTGHFWRKEYLGDYLPMLYLDDQGRIAESNLAAGDEALQRADFSSALAVFEHAYRMGDPDGGFRLANMYGRGLGVRRNPEKAFAIYSELAAGGEIDAENNVGACYEYGNGVPIDYDKAEAWYKAAAEHGSLLGLYNLGGLYSKDLIMPGNDIEGLTLLQEAAERAVGDDPLARYVRLDPPGYLRRLEGRMTPWDISNAKLRASVRIEKDDPLGSD
jgi:lipase maturation factor 1